MAFGLQVRSLQGALLDARTDRLANEFLSAGIFEYGEDFRVRATPSPSMMVRVGSGTAGDRIGVKGTKLQGNFIVQMTQPFIDVPISNGEGQNRRDGIDIKVWDDEQDSSGLNEAEIVVTKGNAIFGAQVGS